MQFCVECPVMDLSSFLGEVKGAKCGYSMFKVVFPYFLFIHYVCSRINAFFQGPLKFWHLGYIVAKGTISIASHYVGGFFFFVNFETH